MRTAIRSVGIVFTVALQACATAGVPPAGGAPSGGSGSDAAEPASAAAKGSATLITEEELRDAPGTLSNAYELIARLRPGMLQSRITPGARRTASLPTIFADNRRLGEIGLLRGIARDNVRSVRYYNAAEARGRFGEGFPGGVIQVTIFKPRD